MHIYVSCIYIQILYEIYTICHAKVYAMVYRNINGIQELWDVLYTRYTQLNRCM